MRELVDNLVSGRLPLEGACVKCGTACGDALRCRRCSYERRSPAMNARLRRLQAATRPAATHSASPWTEAADAELLSPDLSLEELARNLGRSYYAVRSRQHSLRHQKGREPGNHPSAEPGT
ncbi:MAG: hypothetical protein NVS3B24_03960 [Candidatus Dormibacteria bacterium]